MYLHMCTKDGPARRAKLKSFHLTRFEFLTPPSFPFTEQKPIHDKSFLLVLPTVGPDLLILGVLPCCPCH
jgi:hypothetical protein